MTLTLQNEKHETSHSLRFCISKETCLPTRQEDVVPSKQVGPNFQYLSLDFDLPRKEGNLGLREVLTTQPLYCL